jgi:hypothetical protein
MSTRRLVFLTAVVAALFVVPFAGCSTRRDVVVYKLRGRGTQRVYPVTVDQAWIISKTILVLEPTEKIEEHRQEGYMLTSDDSSSLVPTTYMGVFIEPEGPAQAKVTFVTRRRTPTQAYASLTEGAFHRKFAELVKLVAAVGPLPAEGPADAGPESADAADAGSAPEGGPDGGS